MSLQKAIILLEEEHVVRTITLDVGCGKAENDASIRADIDRSASNLDVVCDAHFLPFKDSAFNVVFCSHLLEHLENPNQALKEFKRVSSNLVMLRLPNASHARFDLPQKYPHIFSWNATTLRSLLGKHFEKIVVNKGIWRNRAALARKRQLLTSLKFYLLTLFFEKPELEAICWRTP